MIMKLLKGFLIGCFLIISVLYLVLKPKYASLLIYKSQKIQIRRDQYNIPHIKAQSFKSGLYAWSYVLAEDRLFQLSFRRHLASGRLSQLFGEKGLAMDKMFRELNLKYWAEQNEKKILADNGVYAEELSAFVSGMNDYVNSRIFLPIDFYIAGLKWQPWTFKDTFLMMKIFQYSQGFNGVMEYVRSSLLQNFTKQQVDKMLPYEVEKYATNGRTIIRDHQISQDIISLAENTQIPIIKLTPQRIKEIFDAEIPIVPQQGQGSNSWVISGKYTQSGQPILANDPHLSNAVPGQWYQISFSYFKNNKTINFKGSAITGVPIIIGKSDYFMDAVTTIYADTQDLYKEKIQGDKYLIDGHWTPLKKRVQTIKIKGQPDLQYPVYQTHRGPLIHYLNHGNSLYQFPDQNISFSWIGFKTGYVGYFKYSRIAEYQSHQQIRKTLEEDCDEGPNTNIMYATRDGHIGIQSVGMFPVRRNPKSGVYIKDGTTSQNDWIGIIEGKQKISLHDPQRGFIVAANNRVAGQGYQNDYFGTNIDTARANRIEELIEGHIQKGHKFTIQDMKIIQADTIDVFCLKLLPKLMSLIGKDNLLKGFDCDMRSNSSQATIYQVFFNELSKHLLPSNKYNLVSSHFFYQYVYQYILNSTQAKLYQKLYNQTLNFCKTEFKTQDSDQWLWGKLHEDVHLHRPFSNSQILRPLYERRNIGQGNLHTVNVGVMSKLNVNDYGNYHSANMRQIMSFGQNSYWIIDSGSSQLFYSKHYDDQMKLYERDQYILMDKQSNYNQQPNDL